MNARTLVALELAAIAAAALVFVATFRVRPPYVDFALAGAAVALIALSARRSTQLWTASVRAADTARSAREPWLATGLFTVSALGALAALAALTNFSGGVPLAVRAANWHILFAVALYFPWALLQQYIFQRYLLGRLLQLVPAPLAIVITAVAFSSVHFPRWPVMAVVLIAGTVWSFVYWRWRSLLPLACSHAVLGAALHFWVFGRDLLDVWLPALTTLARRLLHSG